MDTAPSGHPEAGKIPESERATDQPETAEKSALALPNSKWDREEIEQYAALIVYLTEDFLNHDDYFPSITEVSFDKHGCPVILQAYRERLSEMNLAMVNRILDKIGDFIFRKPVAQ